MPARDEAEVGASRPQPLKPGRLIDGGGECRGSARDAHERLARRRCDADRLEFAIHLADLINQADSCPEQRGHGFAETWDGDGSLYPRDEPLTLAGSRPDPEGGAEPADGVVESDTRFDQVCAGGDHRADAMRRRCFDVHLFVKAGSGQLRQPGSVMRIGLVRLHRLEALVRLSRIDAHDRDSQLVQASRNPRRHPAGLDYGRSTGP